MLTSRLTIPSPPSPTSEDIFSSALYSLFPDETRTSHGSPGGRVIYRSPCFGDVELRVPAHPDAEDGRRLFAHYLWNAAIIAADAIECASHDQGVALSAPSRSAPTPWDGRYWDVRDREVLELGAGVALPSLIAARCGARSVAITDHPSSPALVTNTIMENVRANLSSCQSASLVHDGRTSTAATLHGYTWGTSTFYSPLRYGKPSSPQPSPRSFDKIIIADCLWMPSQHANLIKTILHYLRENQVGSSQTCALVVAGFHTGRQVVRNFFDLATVTSDDSALAAGPAEEQNRRTEVADVRGTLRAADMFEIDASGEKRPWVPVRPSESVEDASRWCVCAALVRV